MILLFQKVITVAEKFISDYITENLSLQDSETALDFVHFLKNQNCEFIKDNGYWKNKIYYLIKLKDKFVCFIAIKDPDEPHNNWTVWSDDMSSDFLAMQEDDILLRQSAWKHVDLCGKCGSCGGGRKKIIFGKTFDNVCGCTFRFDNPDTDDLAALKKIVEIRLKEIDKM